MHPSSSSSSCSLLLLLLPLLLPLPRPTGAAPDAECSGAFRHGEENFVLDTEDAVKGGAVLLATRYVRSAEACERACCENPRCNLALLEPRGAAAAAAAEGANRTCVQFGCVHKNRFVCGRFVPRAAYRSYIRASVFVKHLQGPQRSGELAPPIAIAGRDVIVQPGTPVTLNGIQSLALGQAEITAYRWNLQSGNDSVVMEKTDLPDQVRLPHLQPGSYVFQLTVTDSNDQSHSAKVNVLVLSPAMSSLFCRAPPKVGPCRAAFPRWHYDIEAQTCEAFVFGGCKPNENNFLSEEACLEACRGVTSGTVRTIPLPVGEVCGSVCPPDQLICSSGCCLDRSLECDGVEHCDDGSDEDHCSKLNTTFNRLLNIDVNLRKARCSEPPYTGPCRASFSRWYYNPMDRKCYTFTYGGCQGNGNNFEAENECTEMCGGVTEENVFFKGLFERFEKEEESDSGNIALAVLLSVAILALLAILTYCFLKSRKDRHRPVDTGPPHEALPEQDALVYNSTTKAM